MTCGRYQIPVPLGTEKVTPDLLLLACIGFTRDCYRLGYGGGFYDRTLSVLGPETVTVGLAFDALEISELEVESHDLPLNIILTEHKTFGSLTV
ncbi:5-formyltetrahydrofolate cyclo-ligase [Candidatus Pandoraea novymonadis]|uniref:5-formyltetrahydrofolate cyclo-ligase n=2 Tax=Candidatus Pandoraea novymonadis TaxID=1808959 RepID=A0ABX5FCU9_9BURK|nr:5-formyltetrahydrofolate cyclo-ligase [Candidatus Pandoraea novymonadis]